jgi:hypothetical protein
MYSSTFVACCTGRFSGLLALENPTGIVAGQAICLRKVRSVAQQTPGQQRTHDTRKSHGTGVTNRQRGELCSLAGEECTAADHEPARSQLDISFCKDSIEVTFVLAVRT